MSLNEIYNFIQVTDLIGTSGQPTEAQIQEIAGAGYKVLINLAVGDADNALPNEAAITRGLGLIHHHIPVIWEAPTQNNFDQFSAVMDSIAGQKVFVHCAANYRVSMFIALYAEQRWGWTRAQADAHIRRMWEPDEVWSAFIEIIRGKI